MSSEAAEATNSAAGAEPRVSFIVLSYNQSDYVAAAVRAAFAQEGAPLDIILTDDASTDDTFAIMDRLANEYSGAHRVRARRSDENRGLMRHLREAIAEATGDFIILAAGDDISMPNRATELTRRWDELGRSTAFIYSDVEAIDLEAKTVPDWDYVYSGEHTLEMMAAGFIETPGASSALTRDLFDRFPVIPADVIHEDRVLPFRAALLGGSVSYVPIKLVRYRIFGGVSRGQPRDLHDYLYDYGLRANKRLLPDARQRLADVLAVSGASKLQRMCRKTIIQHESRIEMASIPSRRLEASLIKYLCRGARPVPLIYHYLKFRLKRFIAARSRARNPSWTGS
jgi:glycosyltransferase involved in cell wall biosynthesis